ncbi:MAG TPA: hypothetical protein VFZ34_00095 [Blastocatellia bacterium]|nr:hypothetical protein [Blastocatellia bacterium]
MSIKEVKEKHEAALLQLSNVVGVGIGEKDGQPVLVVLATRKLSRSELSPQDIIPARLDGYEVDVVAIGIPPTQIPE